MYQAVNASPVEHSPQIAVVNEHIRLQLPREMLMRLLFFRIVRIDRIKFHSMLSAEIHGLFQQLVLSYSPQNQPVPLFLQHFQCVKGKRLFPSDFRIAVFHNSTVKVNSYDHI